MIWYDFGPIRTSGSIVSTLTLHSLTGTLKGPGPFTLCQTVQSAKLGRMQVVLSAATPLTLRVAAATAAVSYYS